MSDNRFTNNLMERLDRVDGKLEKLLTSQVLQKNRGLSETLNSPEKEFAENLSHVPLDNNDRQETDGSSTPAKDPLPSRVAISAREMDSIIQKVEKINHDVEILERVEKLERQTRKITILGSIFMTLAVLTLGAIAFLVVQVNFFNKGVFSPTKEKVAATRPFFGEKTTDGEKVQSLAPIAKVNDLKSAEPVSRVGDPKVAKPASPEPDHKPEKVTAAVDLVGSITSNKYHYPGCKWAAQIPPRKLIHFSSIEEGRERGYIPCPTCLPPNSQR